MCITFLHFLHYICARIFNLILSASLKGFAGLAVYSGTKFFVEGLSQGMRVELAQTGVRVTCIQPGDVKTELAALNTDTEVCMEQIPSGVKVHQGNHSILSASFSYFCLKPGLDPRTLVYSSSLFHIFMTD